MHQPSCITLFTEGEVNKAIMKMKQLYTKYEFYKIKDVKANKLRNILQLFGSL